MAATKLQMNWSSVGYTPVSASLISITKVQEINFDLGGSLKPYQGDGDKFVTTLVNDMNKPKVTIHTGDVGLAQGLSPGTRGTFTATFNDAMLAVGGAIVYTLANSVVENVPGGGKHADYGMATITMQSYSSDGITSPLSITRS